MLSPQVVGSLSGEFFFLAWQLQVKLQVATSETWGFSGTPALSSESALIPCTIPENQ